MLAEFKEFHKSASRGVDFAAYIQVAGGVAMEAHEVYNAVAERIQQHGYDGIIVIWDEFGFAIEELLRDGQKGVRSLGQETMKLQNFLDTSCGTRDLGKRVIFLGFTHASIPEYATRGKLGVMDMDRLNTVSGRFKNPSIPIRLSVTEAEGYHLLAGMMHRTPAGQAALGNPAPRLQRLADRMPTYQLWSRFSPKHCFDDIVAPCYPLHPAAASTLLLLSDQIAQVNRTSFYFLQNRQEGGLAGQLERRDLPDIPDIGGAELIRVHDMFPFFEEAVRERKRHLYEQYEESLAKFPDANDFDISVVQTILVLSVVASSSTAPSTAFLSFCLCDTSKDEVAAKALHDSLLRLHGAGCLWKNEATEVWNFGGGKGLTSDIERMLEEELALIPELPPTELLIRYPQVQGEIADYLGEFDLDPCTSGIVRRLGIKILDATKDEKIIEAVNPARDTGEESWRSALVYLVPCETEAHLDRWRQLAGTIAKQNVYLVLPQTPDAVGPEIRDLVAVQSLLSKQAPKSHAHEVLESKLTKLRTKLRRQFEQSFGNAGLRSGTSVLRAGPTGAKVQVASWNEFLPAIAKDLDGQFTHQVQVRCGSFNEWQTRPAWTAINKVVERILEFDERPDFQAEYLGFTDTSQEAAIADGVLVENNFLKHNAIKDKWELISVDEDCPCEALKEVLRHFTAGGGGVKDFSKLFVKLIDPAFGIPNGIIPLLVALVIRTELGRIALYARSGSQWPGVPDSETAEAVVQMAKQPTRYQSRYTKLTGRQRMVFKAIGPLIGVPYADRLSSGELFYGFCEKVRSELKEWAAKLPEGVLQLSGLSDFHRKLLRSLRLPVPPHISALADALVEIAQDDPSTHQELQDADSATRDFPATQKLWKEFRTKIDRYVEGVKAPLRAKLRDIVSPEGGDARVGSAQIASAFEFAESLGAEDNPLHAVAESLKDTPQEVDPADAVAAAISGKSIASLTDEDYGRAEGVVSMAGLLKKDVGKWVVVLPSGERRSLDPVEHAEAAQRVRESLNQCQQTFGLSRDQILAIAVGALCSPEEQRAEPPAGNVSNDHADVEEAQRHAPVPEDGTVPGTVG